MRFLAILALAIPVAASAASYDLTVRGGNKLAAVAFATKDTHPESCWLEPYRLVLELPSEGKPGLVEFAARVDKGRPCLEAEGPNRGVLALGSEDGGRLPSLPYGSYKVVVDGEPHGTLVTTRTSVELRE